MAATAALQLSGKPAHAFAFNLTPETIEAALANPKRLFDRELKRAGLDLPYWFSIDINEHKRLHIHGAFAAVLEHHPAIRDAMKAAWGEWKGPGKHKQLWFSPKSCDDEWATYSLRNQRKVAKIIGPERSPSPGRCKGKPNGPTRKSGGSCGVSFLKNSQR